MVSLGSAREPRHVATGSVSGSSRSTDWKLSQVHRAMRARALASHIATTRASLPSLAKAKNSAAEIRERRRGEYSSARDLT